MHRWSVAAERGRASEETGVILQNPITPITLKGYGTKNGIESTIFVIDERVADGQGNLMLSYTIE